MDVKPERTGWRDIGLSLRHREWGKACAAVDIDFLMVEYNRRIPVALVEYKNEHAEPPDLRSANFDAIRVLANDSRIPFYLCRYGTDYSWFEVTALTHLARQCLGGDKVTLSERQYVKFLYNHRRQEMPEDVKAKLIS